MNMEQYKNLTYADSEKINNEKFQQARKEQQSIKGTSYDEEFENKLIEKLEAGEISQAEYNTLSRKSVLDRINEKMRQGEEEVASNPDSVMDTKELELFFDNLSLSADADGLENIIKVKNHIGGINESVTALTASVAELETKLIAQTELTRKYETMIRDYVKQVPVTSSVVEKTVSASTNIGWIL